MTWGWRLKVSSGRKRWREADHPRDQVGRFTEKARVIVRIGAKYDPSQPRVPAGESGGGRWASSGEGGGVVSAHEGLPSRLKNDLDGGAGPSIQWHGTSNRASTFDDPSEVYLTITPDEAEGYARDLHRFGDAPPGGRKKREVFAIRRKPGPVRSIDDEVMEAVSGETDMDVDDVVRAEAARARKDGFRYLYFSHPSFELGAPNETFGEEGTQDVFISLYPDEDLKQVMRRTVKMKHGVGGFVEMSE